MGIRRLTLSEIRIAPWSTLRTSSAAIRISGLGSPCEWGGGDRLSLLVKALSDGSIDRIIEFAAKVPADECEVFIPEMKGAEPRAGECDGHHILLRLCQPQHGNRSPHCLPHRTNDHSDIHPLGHFLRHDSRRLGSGAGRPRSVGSAQADKLQFNSVLNETGKRAQWIRWE